MTVAKKLWANIGFVCVALVLIYCVIHAFDPPRLNWGDSGSDYNVMTSGLNFQKYGFLKLRLTPFLMDPAYMTPDDRIFIYTHYPQLPDLMNGVYRTVFRLSDLVQFRFISLAFSFSALFFIYSLLCTYWTRTTAQVALALWVTNPLWIQHADYLHHAPYGSFFGAGSLFFLVRYLGDDSRRANLLASGVCLFFVYLASYDYWFFAPLLLAMVTAGHHRTLASRKVMGTLAALAVFAVAAVAFKVGTNIWVLGGVDRFVNDLRFQFIERGTDAVTRSSYKTGVWPTMYGRVERFFSLLMFPIAAFWLVAPLLKWKYGERFRALQSVRANPLFLLLAALPFLYLFQEIWVGQYYPALLVLPFYAVASGAVVALCAQSTERSVRLIGVALVVALLANSLDEDIRFKKAFFERETIRMLRAQLDTVSVPGQMLMINHVFDAPYRYYFNRQTASMILNPPGVVELALASFANPATHPKSGKADGAIFVQHKHLTDQMFDKGYYYILGRYHLWAMWGNPPRYRAAIDTLIAERDSVLMSKVARMGTKLYESDAYVVWRVKP